MQYNTKIQTDFEDYIMTTATKNKADSLIGPTDPEIDAAARERLVRARISLLMRHSFFGNIATHLKLVNADTEIETAATNGIQLLYNSRFIMKLRQKEVEFLVAHEVLHVVYDHLGRRAERDPSIFNIANDYAINADLKKHKVGEFITTVPALYEQKYEGMASEAIYDDLMKNIQKIDVNQLLEKLLDVHMNTEDENGDNEIQGMSKEERDILRQELKQVIINAASSEEAGRLPLGVTRLINDITNPIMPWRELIQTTLTSAIKTDFTWMRPSRRSWHMDAIMPGMTPGEEIDVTVALDMSGSISTTQAQMFLSEIAGMMDMFDGYTIRVMSFDTEVYNEQTFTSDNLDDISEYQPQGGGGTNFDCVFDFLKESGEVPKRLIIFTDGYPCGSWGDPDFCDTTFIIHGNDTIVPPWGTYAYLKD